MKKYTPTIPDTFMYQTQEDVLHNDGEEVATFEELSNKIAQLAFVNPSVLLFFRGQSIDYKVGIGEAAFYGPKLDIQIKNVHGKEDTLITIQIDQMLAEKFGMEYVDRDGTKKNPYIIHRTSIGCYERTLALLIEKYAGAFPVWLAPEQVRILPIADRHQDAAYAVKKALEDAGIVKVDVDTRSEKLGYKLREAQLQKIPYMLVVGDKEAEEGTVSVRKRGHGDQGSMSVADFVELIKEEIATRVIW